MYQIYFPAPELRPYIENYWILRSAASTDYPLNEQIFVDGKADVIFNFGVPYQRTGEDEIAASITHSNVDAQRTYPVTIAQTGAIHLIGIRFAPGGLSHFIPLPVYELSNQVVEFAHIFGPAGRDLEHMLYEAAADSRRQTALLDRFLITRFNGANEQRLIRHMSDYLLRSEGNVTVRQLGDHFGYSVRSVDRFFRQVMGFSPKWYVRSLRLQRALESLSQNPDIALADLAYRAGYYDQAHFSKDFRAFTGQTPSDYRAVLLMRRSDPPPNLVQFLQEASSTHE